MDIGLLVQFLAPHLPKLMTLGKTMAEGGAKKFGEKGAEGLLSGLTKLWQKLWPKVEAKPAAKEAVDDVVQNPDDPDALASLRQQLKKILEAPENQALAADVAALLEEIKAADSSGTKYRVEIENSNVGAVGDRNTVTMTVGMPGQPQDQAEQ